MTAETARPTQRAVLEQTDDADRRALEIVSSIVHELRSPLATLVAAAEMLEADTTEDAQRFSCVIERQARRLNGIIDAVLRAYAATGQRVPQVREPVDIAMLVREVCDAHAAVYPDMRFVVTSEELRPAAVDRTMFEVVLSNLLSNAAKYTPAGSRVYVSTHHYEDGLRVVVEDDGPGIVAEDVGRMFAPGVRGAGARAEGYGLGLFIARTVCRAMGGELLVEPPERGQGARFAIEIRSEASHE